MTFWQENYGFIKEVYDTRYDLTSLFEVTLKKAQSTFLKLFRYAKMTEWMDNVEMAIAKVLWHLDLFLLQCYDSGQLLMKNE